MSDAIEPAVPWEYAPAPESTAIVSLEDSYGLFINGEFVGGSDILMELAERGELAEIVAGKKSEG